MSSFAGLEIARRSLAAQLQSMMVVGQNIANANSVGYSRQVGVHAPVSTGSLGVARSGGGIQSMGGVEVAAIKRQYDSFLEARVRELSSGLDELQARQDALARLEELLHEPGEATIGTALEELWSACAHLTTNPNSSAFRNNVLFRADAVAQAFRETASKIDSLRAEMGERAMRDIDRINALAASLAEVNERIVATVPALGDSSPNALLDQRDGLLRELAQFAGIEVSELPRGEVRVTIGGRLLVDGVLANSLSLIENVAGMLEPTMSGSPLADVGGSLGGQLAAHNVHIAHYGHRLADLALAVMEQVNTIHGQGYDLEGERGGALFGGSGARDMAVDPAIVGEPRRLAMSAVPEGSDGSIAQRLADLREQPAGDGSSLTLQYASLIAELGAESASMGVLRDNTSLLYDFAGARREAVAGVSMDDELTDLIRFQQAYSAAARVLTAMDEALEILINRTGLAGR